VAGEGLWLRGLVAHRWAVGAAIVSVVSVGTYLVGALVPGGSPGSRPHDPRFRSFAFDVPPCPEGPTKVQLRDLRWETADPDVDVSYRARYSISDPAYAARTCDLEASLHADGGTVAVTGSPVEFPNGRETTGTFLVRAIRSGAHPLLFRVSAKSRDGRVAWMQEWDLVLDVRGPSLPVRLWRSANDISGAPLVALILLPGAIALAGWLRKRRKRSTVRTS